MKESEYSEHIKILLESAKEVSKSNKHPLIKTAFLAPDTVLRMLTSKDKTAKGILEKSKGVFELVTSDFALYEAISCITRKELDLNSLKEFLYKVEIIPSPKTKIDIDIHTTLSHLLYYLLLKQFHQSQ